MIIKTSLVLEDWVLGFLTGRQQLVCKFRSNFPIQQTNLVNLRSCNAFNISK